jgi:phosphopantetheinyl transferase
MNDTGQLIQNHLARLTNQFKFAFEVVNMRDIENQFPLDGLELLTVLSSAELQHLESLKLHKHKIQWISGRYTVKSALFKYKSGNRGIMNPNCIDVVKGANSAPYLLQYPGLHVSITHSYPYCIGVVAETRIGIDIEAIFDPPDCLIDYFYGDMEQEYLRNHRETGDRSIQAMILWTRKEAVSKLLGLGMKMDFKGLDTLKDQISISGLPGGVIQLVSCTCNNFCLSTAVSIPTS